MKILVGTILAKDDEVQREWLSLQLSFLKATTSVFDHMAIVWGGVKDKEIYEITTVVEPELKLQGSEAHVKGLHYLLHLFKQQQGQFDYFLFLDSDAFPIRVGWAELLKAKLEPLPVFYDDAFISTLAILLRLCHFTIYLSIRD